MRTNSLRCKPLTEFVYFVYRPQTGSIVAVSRTSQPSPRRGRLVLMGSMTTDLPIPYTALMLNNWEIIGQFMYPASAYRRLPDLLRSGLLDISAIRPRVYPLAALPEAMEAAATAGNFECIVMRP